MLDRFRWPVYTALRVVSAFVFLQHGLQKVFGLLEGKTVPLASMYGAAGVIELVGGLLILIGLFTRVAAFVSSGEMAAAYFIAHAARSPFPVLNNGEPAVLLAFIFLYVATVGGGPWSVDGLRRRS